MSIVQNTENTYKITVNEDLDGLVSPDRMDERRNAKLNHLTTQPREDILSAINE